MTNRRISPLFSAAALLGDVGLACSLYGMFLLVERGRLVFPGLWLWLPGLEGCCLTLHLLLGRPRSPRTLVLVCAGFFAVQTAAVFWLQGAFAGGAGMAAAVLFWLMSYVHGYLLVLEPPKVEQLLMYFEISVLGLLFVLFYCSVRGADFVCAIPAGAGTLALLCALIARRADFRHSAGSGRGVGFLLGVGGAFALSALAVAGLAAGGIKKAVAMTLRVLEAAAEFVAGCINALMAFLASLLPSPEVESGAWEAEPSGFVLPEGAEQPFVVSKDTVMLALLILAGLVVLGCAVWLVIKGGGRFAVARMGSGRYVQRQRPGLGRTLRRWLTGLAEAIRFRVRCFLHRDTPGGLLLWLERRGAPRHRGRREGETCREYLRRIAPSYPGAEEQLEQLAGDLDRVYFGPGGQLTGREIRAMRRALAAAGKNSPQP